jgi:excisionase family DNA binding protein
MNERVKDKLIEVLRGAAQMNERITALVAVLEEQEAETPKIVVERKMEKEMLTVQEAMAYTGYTRSYLYKLFAWKELSYSKPTGGRVFVKRTELDRFMARNEYKSNKAVTKTAEAILNGEWR